MQTMMQGETLYLQYYPHDCVHNYTVWTYRFDMGGSNIYKIPIFTIITEHVLL